MQFPEKIPGNYWEPAYSIICHNMPKLENWIYSKKPHNKWGFSSSTRGRTRTGTSLRTMDFKSAVSTNSTTRATGEASAGFEPANDGFANRSLKPLGYDAIDRIFLKNLRRNLQYEFQASIYLFLIYGSKLSCSFSHGY